MGRPNQLTDNQPSPATWVNNVQYGPAGELKQISYGLAYGYGDGARLYYGGSNTETRQYNSRTQLTRLTAPGMGIEYRYSATQNNGQITAAVGRASDQRRASCRRTMLSITDRTTFFSSGSNRDTALELKLQLFIAKGARREIISSSIIGYA